MKRLTTRQRLRRVRYGLPNAVRMFVLAVAASFAAGALLGLLLMPGKAHAIGTVTGTPTPTQNYYVTLTKRLGGTQKISGGSGAGGATSACQAYLSAKTTDQTYGTANGGSDSNTYSYVSNTTATCVYHRVEVTVSCPTPPGACSAPGTTDWGNGSLGLSVETIQVMQCPPGAADNGGGQCICALGTKPDTATSCAAYQCPVKPLGEFNTRGSFSQNGKAVDFTHPAYLCDTLNTGTRTATYGCSMRLDLEGQTQDVGAPSTLTNWWKTSTTGGPCQGDGTGSVSAPSPGSPASGVPYAGATDVPASATPCKVGFYPGTVNGLSGCYGGATTSTGTTVQSSSVNASGVATVTGTVGTTATCIGTMCTVTQTTTDGTGAVTGIVTSQNTLGEYCSKSAGDPQCAAAGLGAPVQAASGTLGSGGGGAGGGGDGNGSGFGGTCGAGWTCTGDSDAVTCAIATEQHVRDCQFFGADGINDGTASSRGYAAYAAGDTPGDHPRAAGNVTSKDMGGGFDQTDLIGGGCVADQAVSIGGRSVVIAYSKICPMATTLGNVLVSLTALACLGIAFVRGA